MRALLLLVSLPLAGLAQSGSLQFSSLAFTVKESAPLAKITVNRLSGSQGTVTVDFATVNSGGGNATPMEDYVSTNGTLTFGPGVTTRYFYVPILDDAAHEGNETVVLELSNPSEGATLAGQPNTTLTIQDNDPCSYATVPTGRSHNQAPGFASFEVLAPLGCGWTAESTVAWIGIFAGAAGIGNGTITYSYDPLPGDVTSRTGEIRVGGTSFTITQMVDLAPPAISFLTPGPGSRQTNSSILVTGRASDAVGVTLVEIRLENSSGNTEYAPTTNTTSWSATVNGLLPGTNTLRARAHDEAGNIQEAALVVVYVQVSPITLAIDGNGVVTGLKSGQLLEIGRTYTVQAKAASGHFFNGWSGSLDATENPLSFAMGPAYNLQANFIPSPFTPVAGTYSGLLFETTTNHHESSGSVNVTVGALGTFSAKLTVGGVRSSFSGRFALDGKATNAVARREGSALSVVLNLDLNGGTDSIDGTINGGAWEAAASAYRDLFDTRTNPAPQAGRYTFIIPGDVNDAANQPGGDGFGTLLVGADGTAKLSGSLADGTKVTAKATLSKDGYWPLYLSLYGGQGSLHGWLRFADVPDTSDLNGPVSWFRPANSTAKYYGAGFAIQPALTASRYFAPSNDVSRVLSLSEGRIAFAGGDLPETFEDAIGLSATGVVTNLGPHKMTSSIQNSSGLFSGAFTAPGATRSTAFRGVVHQKANFASGFFLGTNQTGRARLTQ